MAFAASVIWEERPTSGSSANGGGFDPTSGTPGTDYSQQASPQITYTDLVIDGTTNTKCTSAGNPFTSAHVGNIINITSGTGFTVQRVQVMSVAGGVATCDKSLGTLGSTGGNGKLGGALASIANVATLLVPGNIVHHKNSGGDALTTTPSLNAGLVALPIYYRGYNSTRGDIDGGTWAATHLAKGFLDTTNFPAITWSSGTPGITLGINTQMTGMNINGAVAGPMVTIGTNSSLYRCKVNNTSSNGAATAVTMGVRGFLVDNWLLCTTTSGGFCVSGVNQGHVIGNCITSAAGGGVSITATVCTFIFNTFYSMLASQVAIAGVINGNDVIVNNTFDSILGTCYTAPNSAQTNPLPSILINNTVSNCGTFANNLRSATQTISLFAANNRIRDTTTAYVGWTINSGFNDVTTDDSDAGEYNAQGSQDFRLLYAALGVGTGMPYGIDIGACQRKENLPTVGQVQTGVAYGLDKTTLGTPNEKTGTLAGGGGSVFVIEDD